MRRRAVLAGWMMAAVAWTGAGVAVLPPPVRAGAAGIQLTIAGGSLGGVYYPLAVGIAEVVSKNVPGVTATPQVTEASTQNVVLAGTGEVDIAIATAGDLYKASLGEQPFPRKFTNLSVWFGGLRPGAVQVVVRRDSPIRTLADLRGKRVSLGPRGGGGLQAFLELMPAYGLRLSDLRASYVSYQESADQLGDGNLDAAVIVAATPTPAVTQLASTTPVRLVPVERDRLERFLQEHPYYVAVTVPRTTYNGMDQDVLTFATVNLAIIRDDLSEELVYQMTRAIFENLPQLHAVHAAVRAINLDSATAFKGFRYHPGAARYFREVGRPVPTQ